MTDGRPKPGAPTPVFDIPLVGGGLARIGGPRSALQLCVVYRGRHCPWCKKYLAELSRLLPDFGAAGCEVIAVSADPFDKARADVEEEGWPFAVGYGLSIEQMRHLGLFVSEPRSQNETDRPFAEPGVFVTNAEGLLQIVDVSNAPWVRPDLENLLDGVRRVLEANYPIRGTL